MRIIPFPQPGGASGEPTPTEIEAALHGDAVGESAERWRDLRADVRALAPPPDPQLERRLRERIEARAPARPTRRGALRRPRAAATRIRGRLAGGWQRPALVAGVGVSVLAAIATLALVGPWNAAPTEKPVSALLARPDSGPAIKSAGESAAQAARPRQGDLKGLAHASGKHSGEQSQSVAPATAEASGAAGTTASAQAAAPARVQQRAASLTLAAKPEAVQSVSDRVAQLTVREGGFVQSSQVNLESGTGGEANLHLSLPSARLSAALASLARLAPTRAESQSLQDITDEYDAAQRKLGDAVAERQALLRALSRASTQGQIESLRARLSLAGGAIARARQAFQSVSSRGSDSAVEVTVLGDSHAASGGGLGVSRGLHDAGDVLRVLLAVLLIALAVLVPLAALLTLLALGWRAGRRRLRERALA